MKKLLSLTAVAAALMAPQWAAAESDVNTAAGPSSTATARLDFQIVIPRVLFLQVGTGTVPIDDNSNVDLITFTVPAANLGDGTNVAGTGGNLTGGAVDVRVFGNNGNISLAAASGGSADINNGSGDTIPWTELLVTAAAGAGGSGFTATSITHPTINGAATTITATNKVVRQHGTWTYAYDNSTAYAAGTYGGANANNGRITYTATLP